MRRALPLLLLPLLLPTAAPALADGPPPHSGLVRARSMPELSDVALFGLAALGVWAARRAMRARFRRQGFKPQD